MHLDHPFHSRSPEETLAHLEAREAGLTSEEAEQRRQKFGPNILPEQSSDGALKILWRQINDPLIWVLIGSAGIAWAADPVNGTKNGAVILAVVVINTLIGFIQEWRAGRAIDSLKNMSPEYTTVQRDGKKQKLPAGELVPGDIVFLASGDRVPADVRILHCRSLRIEEAALTGESLPSEKGSAPNPEDSALGDRTSMAYGGTLVNYGTGHAVVSAIGAKTELGKISDLIQHSTDLKTPLTKSLESVGKWLSFAIILFAGALLLVAAWRTMAETGLDVWSALRQNVIFAVTLAVGAIPEGLPAIVTIALAVGVQRMAKRRAIVRKLPSVETLGSTSVICSDKTGTLTKNEMTVVEIWTPESHFELSGVGYEPQGTFTDKNNRGTPLFLSESFRFWRQVPSVMIRP